MPVNLDEMTVKQLRKHAGEVAKALARKEAARAKKLRKRVVSYTQELGENLGEFFSKTLSSRTEEPATKDDKTQAASTKAAKTKSASSKASPKKAAASKASPAKTTAPKASSAKATASKAGPAKTQGSKAVKYIEPDGTPRQRLGKWSEKYSKTQIESMKQT